MSGQFRGLSLSGWSKVQSSGQVGSACMSGRDGEKEKPATILTVTSGPPAISIGGLHEWDHYPSCCREGRADEVSYYCTTRQAFRCTYAGDTEVRTAVDIQGDSMRHCLDILGIVG